jgi:hypothetical protein
VAALALSCGGARSNVQYAPGLVADFRTAAAAEVRDAQGQVVLSGQFVESTADASEIERRAALAAVTGGDADATGAVEVEFCRDSACDAQEVEFTVSNLTPGTVVRLLIDGKEFATVTTDDRGGATAERDVPFPR